MRSDDQVTMCLFKTITSHFTKSSFWGKLGQHKLDDNVADIVVGGGKIREREKRGGLIMAVKPCFS